MQIWITSGITFVWDKPMEGRKINIENHEKPWWNRTGCSRLPPYHCTDSNKYVQRRNVMKILSVKLCTVCISHVFYVDLDIHIICMLITLPPTTSSFFGKMWSANTGHGPKSHLSLPLQLFKWNLACQLCMPKLIHGTAKYVCTYMYVCGNKIIYAS